jgi:hypothetical protein
MKYLMGVSRGSFKKCKSFNFYSNSIKHTFCLAEKLKLSVLMIITVIQYNLWLASSTLIDIQLFHYYLDLAWSLTYRGVKAQNSGQVLFTKFSFGIQFHCKNFLNSLFELILINIITWNKLNSENFIFDHFHNYEHFVKNYGYRSKSNLTSKIPILHFPAMADDIMFKSYMI